MPLKPTRRAAMCYIWQYNVYRARPIREAPPALRLHYEVLRRRGLLARWHTGRTGYRIPRP